MIAKGGRPRIRKTEAGNQREGRLVLSVRLECRKGPDSLTFSNTLVVDHIRTTSGAEGGAALRLYVRFESRSGSKYLRFDQNEGFQYVSFDQNAQNDIWGLNASAFHHHKSWRDQWLNHGDSFNSFHYSRLLKTLGMPHVSSRKCPKTRLCVV